MGICKHVLDGIAVSTIHFIAGACPDLLAQMVPPPFGQLITQRLLSHTLMFGRFDAISELFPDQDVPRKGWLDVCKPVHRPAQMVELEASKFRDVADRVRLALRDSKDDTGALEAIQYLDNVAATLAGTGVMSNRQRAMKEIHSALALIHAKSHDRMKRVLHHGAFGVVPVKALQTGSFSSSTRKAFTDKFRLDIAYMLVSRDQNFAHPMIRFGWADSSPQGPFDFFVLIEVRIRRSSLRFAAQAMRFLQTTAGGTCTLNDIDDTSEVPLRILTERKDANSTLCRLLEKHMYVTRR